MTTPKEVLRRYHIRPSRKLSQSFLVDSNTLHKIAGASRVCAEDIVVEIGAGIGVLTKEIAKMAGRVVAVEIDSQLVEVLHQELGELDNVEIWSGDILKFDIASISNNYNKAIKVIGNVPYNISSPVIFHLLAQRQAIDSFTLMLQKEVVERLVSEPAHKSYGVPSVLLQMHADVERLFDVSATCFYPVPKVASSVMRGTFREKPLVDLADEAFFSRLVKASFAQRRKMLINNLKNAGFLELMPETDLKSALHEAGIDGRRRGETLSLNEFGILSNILKYRLTNPC